MGIVDTIRMSGTGYDDTVQFRAGVEKKAAEVLDDIRLGGINISELAREGLKEMLQRTLSEEDKIRIYRRYEAGEIDDEVVQVFLGDDLNEIARERAAFEEAIEFDTDDLFQE